MGNHADDPARRRWSHLDAARVGQQRLDDLLLFRGRAEARREFDLGELRQRRRVALPVLAGLGGMIVPVGIFLALNNGRDSAAGRGDDVHRHRLARLLLVVRGLPDRVRIFLLTVVVDDLVALLVIATVYSGPVALRPLLLALGLFGSMLLLRLARIRFGLLHFLLAAAAWVALQVSGVEPVVLGLRSGSSPRRVRARAG